MIELDLEQRQAVEAGPVDLFISAGAGSGKTRVLTARFVSAVLGLPPYEACDPGAVVAVTYTEKAAGELAERIRRSLSAEARHAEARQIGDAWISTIHGMCARILRQHAFDAGLDPQFTVLDEAESSVLEVAALEEAVLDLIAEDTGLVELIDAYGFESVAAAARRVRSDVRGLGLAPCDITTAGPNDMRDVLADAAEALAGLAEDFVGMRQTKTVENNAASARFGAMLLAEALASAEIDVAHALESLQAVRFRRLSTIEGHDECVEAARELTDRARSALAQIAVTPFEDAFLRLVDAFDARLAAAKRDRGALDFQDLQIATAHLLESRPDIARRLRERFAMLMVDEFQDTDELELSIVEKMARGNLCTVGDESQSIYAFRNADVEVFRRRSREVEAQVRLQANYRTAPPLLDALNALFSQEALLGTRHAPLAAPAVPAERGPWPEGESRFAVRLCDPGAVGGMTAREVEIECIAGRVAELVGCGVAPGHIAVLLGALKGGRAESLARALERRCIPAHFVSGGDFFDCREVAEARALLRVINNVRDDAAVATLLRGTMTGLSDDGMFALRTMADARAGAGSSRDGRLWPVAAAPPDLDALDRGDRALLARTVEAVEWARGRRGLAPLGEIVLQVLLRLDVDLALLSAGPAGKRAWANLMKLVRFADEYEQAGGGDLGGLLDFLAMREEHTASEREAVLADEEAAVRVMSIHAAKGLEFPVVIVGGLDRGSDRAPIRCRRIDGVPLLGMRLPGEPFEPTIASERVAGAAATVAEEEAVRLLYVACTRAREGLTIVARTDPDKDASTSLGGLVRRALGMGPAGAVVSGERAIGSGSVRVDLVEVAPPMAKDALLDAPACAPPEPLPLAAPVRDAVFGAPKVVSYTGLSRYQTCPYSFYATAIARLPGPPSAAGSALAFGTAAHAVLERCEGSAPSSADLEAAADGAGLERRDVGRVRDAVDAFLRSATATEVLAADRVLREAPIAVPVGGLVLSGAIDVIAWRGDEALVVDYKTGAGAPTPHEAEERYRLQGACYALAALAAGARSVRVVFFEIEVGREIAYAYTTDDRPMLEAAISTITDRMRAGDYAPRGTYEADSCERCPAFGSLCPVSRPTATSAG